MPLVSSFSAASSRGEGEFNLLQDSNTSVIIYAVSTIIAATPSSPSAGSVTYQTTTRHFLQVGWSVVVANVGGASSGSYNGTFTVNSVTDVTFTVTNSATGTATFPYSPLATVTPPNTWTCPSNVYNIHVLCIGAGGGGGLVANSGSTKNAFYSYTSSPNGGTSAFKDGATTLIAASGGGGQTTSTSQPVLVSGGEYSITPPLGSSYQGYGGGKGGGGGYGGGGAGGYSGDGGSAQDNSAFTISTLSIPTNTTNKSPSTGMGATDTTFVAPSPPWDAPTSTAWVSLVNTTTPHNYAIGDLVNIFGGDSSYTSTVTSITYNTGTGIATYNTSSAHYFQVGDAPVLDPLPSPTSGTVTSIQSLSTTGNTVYTASNTFGAGEIIQLTGAGGSNVTAYSVNAAGTLITYICSNSLAVNNVVTIDGLNISNVNLTGKITSRTATQFTVTVSGFPVISATGQSGVVYRGFGNREVTLASATSTTFTVNAAVTGFTGATPTATTTMAPVGTITGAWNASYYMDSPTIASTPTATSFTAAISNGGPVSAISVLAYNNPGYVTGYGTVYAVPSTTSFKWNLDNTYTNRASSGGYTQRIATTGSGGSGGSGTQYIYMWAGGGVWLNGTGALVPMNGYANVYQPGGGSSGVIIISGSATASVATFTCDPRYPPNIYLTSGGQIDVYGLGAPFTGYNSLGSYPYNTGTTATTFTMTSLGTISGGATIAISGTAYSLATAGEAGATFPTTTTSPGGRGGVFGGGGVGSVGGGGGGALAWLDNLSVIPGTTYTIQVGSGGIAPLPVVQRTITNASGNGASVVYTYTGAANTFVTNMYVTITGVTPTGYNLVNVVITAFTANTFTVASTVTGSYSGSGGIATLQYSIYNYDGGGGHGAVRIMYGRDKQFPYTNVL